MFRSTNNLSLIIVQMKSFITLTFLAILMTTQAIEGPMAGQSMPGQSMAAQSMAGQSMAGQSMAGQSMAAQSMAGQSMAGQSMAAQPMRPMILSGGVDNSMISQPMRSMMQATGASNALAPVKQDVLPAGSMMQATGASNALAPVKQDVLPAGSMRIDLSPKQVAFIAGGIARVWKHRTLVYNVLSGQWSEIDGTTVVLDVIEFEAHLWIAQKISDYVTKTLPIEGMGNVFVQLGYLALADTYLTRQRLKGLISGMDETKVSFANEVSENFSFLGDVVVAKLASQVNMKETGQMTTFVINREVENPPIVTAFIFRIEGHVVYKVALFNCIPKKALILDKKTHVFLELASDDCQRASDDVVYMMNLK
jgi:hypothetical protein